MTVPVSPRNPAIKALIARLRAPDPDLSALVLVREELLRELASGTLLVIVREVPPEVAARPTALPDSVDVEILTTTLPDGRRKLPVFTDVEEIEARGQDAPWVAAPGRRWMQAALQEYDGLVVNPGGKWWEVDADDLREALGPGAPRAKPERASPSAGRAGPAAPTSIAPSPPLTLEQARALARDHAKGFVLADVIERDWGWAFSFDSPEHARSGRMEDMLFGLGSVLVDRHDGSVHSCGSSMPVTAWIEEYERKRARSRGTGGLRGILGWLWPGRHSG